MRYFPISYAIFPMFSAVWCGPKSHTYNLDPETPKSSVEFYYISWGKLDPEKIAFFFFFLSLILSFLWRFFPCFRLYGVGLSPKL